MQVHVLSRDRPEQGAGQDRQRTQQASRANTHPATCSGGAHAGAPNSQLTSDSRAPQRLLTHLIDGFVAHLTFHAIHITDVILARRPLQHANPMRTAYCRMCPPVLPHNITWHVVIGHATGQDPRTGW